MDNNDIFFDDPSPTPNSDQPPKYTKPTDDFRPLLTTPSSVLYLAVTTPHTDTYEIHGPATSFAQLLPTINDIVSNSPSAIDKLETLAHSAPDAWGSRTTNTAFEHHGFTTLIVDGQRGTATVLDILREHNPAVRAVLPAPVYTVSRHGPLVHGFVGVGAASRLGPAVGVAATSALVGSFVERGEAVAAARAVMDGLVRGEVAVSCTEDWGDGVGGGVLLAMGGGRRWEVRVKYEDEALRRAREGADAEGAGVGWRF